MGSLTGYLGKARSVARFENEFKTQAGGLYYEPTIGFDFSYWQMGDVNFSADAFNTWIIDESVKKAIIVLSSRVSVDQFTLKLEYTLAGVQGSQSLQGFYGGIN